jgi:hypothetical protein
MTAPDRLWYLAALACAVVLALQSFCAAEDDARLRSRRQWRQFLDQNCRTGQSEQVIRQLMDKKYRDMGRARAGNPEFYRLLFAVDDLEIEFYFDDRSRLRGMPTIEPKGQWIRLPNGEVRSIPDPAEVALKSEVGEIAIRYVVRHTEQRRESLSAHCTRSDDASQTWRVVVTETGLETDTPIYLLEVTEAGNVSEVWPIEKRRP